MRYNRRYSRVLGIITDPAIPRTRDGGIALCHLCQRSVMFANGFLRYVIEIVHSMATARGGYLRGGMHR